MSDAARLSAIYRYPVKGLSSERLEGVALSVGSLLPGDRSWAIEQGSAQFDPEHPRHFPKTKFLMLMRDEKLAALHTVFDDSTHTLHIKRDGKQVAKANLSTPIGRGIAEQFFAAYLGSSLPGKPRIVHGGGHAFTDVPERWVSLINLASVRDLERVVGQSLDPLRFRANLYIDGLRPWAEKDWVGTTIRIGGTILQGEKLIVRCAATNVNPSTAERDQRIPQTLDQAFGENVCGLYLSVSEGGPIQEGDSLQVVEG